MWNEVVLVLSKNVRDSEGMTCTSTRASSSAYMYVVTVDSEHSLVSTNRHLAQNGILFVRLRHVDEPWSEFRGRNRLGETLED
jgi:hypothetical protein